MAELELPGLSGNNPLGFLAALGVQVAFAGTPFQPLVRWSDGVVPVPRVTADLDHDGIVARVLEVATQWRAEPALCPVPEATDVKFPAAGIRTYLSEARHHRSGALAASLVAEGSLDAVTGKKAKPTDFHFTAGQMKFLAMARKILASTTSDDLIEALVGPWQYTSKLPSLRWDIADDRAYALSAFDPTDNTNNPKLTVPGAECLAILGLSMFPVFPGHRKTATTGCRGTWRDGSFSWPLWNRPATLNVARTLVAHANAGCLGNGSLERALPSLGVFRILESSIRRNDRAMGLANFGPPEVVWWRD
ncbi:hypothetical protein [Candidatus Poriferisodalis sp.]|uniref:type I-G CRISPR-associated protein, Cas3-extension family n=1 Tax=Candidatus Poriferisodalis sp. TaxID=3101277 RepID=UPI003B02BD4C